MEIFHFIESSNCTGFLSLCAHRLVVKELPKMGGKVTENQVLTLELYNILFLQLKED